MFIKKTPQKDLWLKTQKPRELQCPQRPTRGQVWHILKSVLLGTGHCKALPTPFERS